MKKTILLLSTALIQLTAAYAQQTQPSESLNRTKALLESRLNDVLKVDNVMRFRDGDETPLAQSRRIIKQEYFSSDHPSGPELTINYGYTSANKGQEFHPSMIFGFPRDISIAGKADRVFFSNDLFLRSDINYNFPLHELGTEIVIDTLDLYSDGELIRSVIAQRGTNNRIDTITKTEIYGTGMDIVKSEKFYTNNLLTKVDEYYGENLSTLELSSRRMIAYNNNQKIASDTLLYYDMGAIDETMVFVYSYNNNDKVTEITMSSDYGDSAFIAVNYYPDGRFKSDTISLYSTGDLEVAFMNSIAYAANGFIATRKSGFGFNDGSGNIAFEYIITDMTYNGNLLDTVKITGIDQLGQMWENGFGKYHYSIDHNPDSLMVSNVPGMPPDEKMIFHYQPYNTTSVKNIARNNNFNIYPNPIGATINVYNKVALKDRKATIMITDIKGARIWSVEQALAKGANQINIPAYLSAGTYVITITADNSVYTQKVIKQ